MISLRTSVKGGAQTRCVKCVDSCCIYTVRLSFVLNGSSEIACFKHRDAIEIQDGITFVFYMYPGLSYCILLAPEIAPAAAPTASPVATEGTMLVGVCAWLEGGGWAIIPG